MNKLSAAEIFSAASDGGESAAAVQLFFEIL